MSTSPPKADNLRTPVARRYDALKRGLLLIGFILPLVPTLVLALIILFKCHTVFKENAHEDLRGRIEHVKRSLSTFMDSRLRAVRHVLESAPSGAPRDSAFLGDVLLSLEGHYGSEFVELGLFDAQGRQIAYAGPRSASEENRLSTESFPRASSADEAVARMALDERGAFRYSQSARLRKDGDPAYFRFTVRAEHIRDIVGRIHAQQTEAVYILNRHGVSPANSGMETAPPDAVVSEILDNLHDTGDAVSITRGKDETGRANLYATTRFDRNDRLLVLRQPVSEAYAGLSEILIVSAAVVGMISLFLAANAFALSKKVVQRIAAADKRKQKKTEQMLQTGKLASIGELAAGIAHEINNPVAIMVEEAGWIDDLLEEEEFKQSENLEEFKRALKQIQTQGKRCKAITQKLLSFSRASDFSIAKVRLAELIEDVISITTKRLQKDHVDVRMNIQADLPELDLARNELQQVLINLVNNAIDAFGDAPGTLTLSAELSGDDLQIVVADSGCGILPVHQDLIFDPFFTTKKVGKGTGLGLSICYGLIRKMGGDIRLESAVDRGTTFYITIPVPMQKIPESRERYGELNEEG